MLHKITRRSLLLTLTLSAHAQTFPRLKNLYRVEDNRITAI